MATRTHRIAAIGGDGIGPEVVAEGLRVLEVVAGPCGFAAEVEHLPWGCGYYLEHRRMMPEDGIATLSGFDAIYLGAVGLPGVVAEEVAVRGLVLAIRFGFDQYRNVRPVRPLPGAPYPLVSPPPEDVDFVVVREATEGIYAGLGGRYLRGAPELAEAARVNARVADSSQTALQTGVFTEIGCRRVIEAAFRLAEARAGRRRVSSATKANAMNFAMPMWNEIFDEVAAGHPGIEAEWMNVDAMAMRFVTSPQHFDVVVAPNLFGDILTDLSAALLGGLGFAPSANLSDAGPSMFEPCHGSAPDIAGRGIANPTAALLSLEMMLEDLGEPRAADAVGRAVRRVVAQGRVRTLDMGGDATTREVGEAVAAAALDLLAH
ncbi:MAG TPA: isocitrate/isopropylmalate dehydrogenase family protein [Armatimonadota bacterium]|nr:isocitrate/isopropylmalate dehydrogenase family protein [Armatimonadota bacterium]